MVHGANMGPIWDRHNPGGPHVGPINLAIWAVNSTKNRHLIACMWGEGHVIIMVYTVSCDYNPSYSCTWLYEGVIWDKHMAHMVASTILVWCFIVISITGCTETMAKLITTIRKFKANVEDNKGQIIENTNNITFELYFSNVPSFEYSLNNYLFFKFNLWNQFIHLPSPVCD